MTSAKHDGVQGRISLTYLTYPKADRTDSADAFLSLAYIGSTVLEIERVDKEHDAWTPRPNGMARAAAEARLMPKNVCDGLPHRGAASSAMIPIL